MPIEASEPTAISATYDKWAFSFFSTGFPIAEPGGNEIGKVSCTATLVKYRTRDDGVDERSPLQSDVRTVRIDDVYSLIPTRPKIAAAFGALMQAVEEEADLQGAR